LAKIRVKGIALPRLRLIAANQSFPDSRPFVRGWKFGSLVFFLQRILFDKTPVKGQASWD
jgi:hypothetical protein